MAVHLAPACRDCVTNLCRRAK